MKSFIDIKSFIFPETDEKLECSLVSCGHENRTSQSYRNYGLKRGKYEVAIWQYTLSGSGIYEYAGEKHILRPGQAFIALVPENHIYYLPQESPNWEFIYLTLVGENSIKLFRAYRKKYGSVINFSPDSEVVQSAWDIINTAKKDDIECAYQLSGLAYDFLMKMFCEARFIGTVSSNVPVWVEQVKAYCAKNIASDILIDDLAAIANCSKWHFSRRFAEYEGVSPHRYLMEMRVKYAVQLMENSTFSLKEIAERCGFYDLSYFGKVFKSYMQISPKKYRK